MLRKVNKMSFVAPMLCSAAFAGAWLLRPSRGIAAGDSINEPFCDYCQWKGEIYSLGALVPDPKGTLRCTAVGWKLYGTGTLAEAESRGHSKISVGTELPSISVLGVGPRRGKRTIQLAGSERATVLYFYTPGCPSCDQNSAKFSALVNKAKNSYHFIVVYTVPGGGGNPANGASVVDAIASPETVSDLDLHVAPETVVVAPDGHVVEDWVGAWHGNILAEIENYFGVQLPGPAH